MATILAIPNYRLQPTNKPTRWLRFITALIIIPASLVFCGCSSGNAPAPEPTTTLEKGAIVPPNSPINGPMPTSLNEAYESAEQVFRAVSSSDWTSAATAIEALKRSLVQVREDLKGITTAGDSRAGVVTGKEDLIESDLDSLERTTRAHDRESATREANRLTMPIAELAGMYANAVPGELMMLKYYNRQFDIAAATDDAPLLKETASDVRRIWSGLRPTVEAHGGATEARRFNDLVNDLEKKGPPGQLGGVLRDRISEIQAVLQR